MDLSRPSILFIKEEFSFHRPCPTPLVWLCGWAGAVSGASHGLMLVREERAVHRDQPCHLRRHAVGGHQNLFLGQRQVEAVSTL